ncbi:hypothetical protein ACIQVK_19090 [Streptomyces sp. NPDC090493]|uniref:hypothetical protein n=1 Tax=Streptomyces sp. NPDC090493 TaxID=3365964 RepID=UPI00381D8397
MDAALERYGIGGVRYSGKIRESVPKPAPLQAGRRLRNQLDAQSRSACWMNCSMAAALGSHRWVHRDHTSSTPPARASADITPETPQKAKHDMPAPMHQRAPVDAAEQRDDLVAMPQHVREALGPDSHVTHLEARAAEFEAEVAHQKQGADEAHARLALIQEAFHA